MCMLVFWHYQITRGCNYLGSETLPLACLAKHPDASKMLNPYKP